MQINGGIEYRESIKISLKRKRLFSIILHLFDFPRNIFTSLAIPLFLSLVYIFISYLFFENKISLLYAIINIVFLILDIICILSASKRNISYGPLASQLFIMSVPRVGVVIFSCISSLFLPIFGSVSILLTFQFFGTVVYFYGMLYEAGQLTISKMVLTTPKISSSLKFVHLTDLHIEKLSIRERKIIHFLNTDIPDFVFLTGDYLNFSDIENSASQKDLLEFLKKIPSRYGVFACMGSPPVDHRDKIKTILNSAGICLLQDQSTKIKIKNNKLINIIGINCDHRQKLDSSVLLEMNKYIEPLQFNILLFHSPEIMATASKLPIDIYLCGHTHGGQVRMPFYGALVTSSVTGKQYEMGHYLENGTNLYVSRGIGLEGKAAPRFRILCPPELVSWNIN